MSSLSPRHPKRHTEPVDVHVILRRGGEVLLTRRAGEVYASGLLHLPSGHLDGPHETILDAAVREAREETGVLIDPAEVRAAVVVHHRSPAGQARTGFFFEARRWQGQPHITEPHLCSDMGWWPLDALPGGMVAYCRAGLDAYRAGRYFATHFQHPGDPIAHQPGPGHRLALLPHTTPQHPPPAPAADRTLP
ncbi:ADP-ribose pyrophosphatase YjhB, NUDIX family [Streptomyces aidingensis]|uniref:ADP-ribose pyrophosphatase YjhB, NUDIX family n=1 Tax=Streptomyces aidingensis TaxID=910347 RepID=A0A1I1KQB3_9ACTN|nr:ADP-ribose pyrophosphatase YjhB, NUDIX family [Streptomyces aidingensis]